jgi:hypothetical protein
MAAVRETDQLKPIDKAVFGTVSELPGRNESERKVTSKENKSGGRALDVGVKAAWAIEIWLIRELTPAGK